MWSGVETLIESSRVSLSSIVRQSLYTVTSGTSFLNSPSRDSSTSAAASPFRASRRVIREWLTAMLHNGRGKTWDRDCPCFTNVGRRSSDHRHDHDKDGR